MTGATVLTFGYDAAGRLTSITDDKQLKTTIERDGAAEPTARSSARTGIARCSRPTPTATCPRSQDPTGAQVRMTYGDGRADDRAHRPARRRARLHLRRRRPPARATATASAACRRSRARSDGDAIVVTLRTAEGRVTRYRHRARSPTASTSARSPTRRAARRSIVDGAGRRRRPCERPTGERETLSRSGPTRASGCRRRCCVDGRRSMPSGKTRTAAIARTVDLVGPRRPAVADPASRHASPSTGARRR